MKERKNLDLSSRRRLRIAIYFLILLTAVLVARLYFLQVMSGEIYAEEAQKIILRSKTLAAPRGNIYDRNGRLLVKSVPSPAIAVDPRVVLANEEVLDVLCTKLKLAKAKVTEKLKKSNISYLERVVLKQNIDYETMIYFKENSSSLPGVEVIDVFLREYEYGNLAAHILGYTGEIDEDKLKSSQYSAGYEGGDQIGLSGVEAYYENILKGTKGKVTYEVDPIGKPRNMIDKI